MLGKIDTLLSNAYDLLEKLKDSIEETAEIPVAQERWQLFLNNKIRPNFENFIGIKASFDKNFSMWYNKEEVIEKMMNELSKQDYLLLFADIVANPQMSNAVEREIINRLKDSIKIEGAKVPEENIILNKLIEIAYKQILSNEKMTRMLSNCCKLNVQVIIGNSLCKFDELNHAVLQLVENDLTFYSLDQITFAKIAQLAEKIEDNSAKPGKTMKSIIDLIPGIEEKQMLIDLLRDLVKSQNDFEKRNLATLESI